MAIQTSRTAVPHGSWTVDPARSAVGFRVRHFGVATVEGRFATFAGRVAGDRVEGTVDVATVETGHPVRDARLRSEFFDAERFPQVVFEGELPCDGCLRGKLTIRDVTRPVVLELGPGASRPGAPALRARATLSRRAFGLDWPALIDAGRLIVADRVDLLLDVALLPA